MIYPQESTVILWITVMDSCNPHCDAMNCGCIGNYTLFISVVIIDVGIVLDENDPTKIIVARRLGDGDNRRIA